MKLIFFIAITFFIPNLAFAYIDPGGLGAIFNLFIAGIVTSLFYLKSNLLIIFQNIKNFIKDLKNFIFFLKTKKSIVIYCENSQYLKYYGTLLDNLSTDKDLDVILLIDKKNQYLNKFDRIKKIFIKTNFLKNLILSLINCEILIITTPDIGNNYVKKSNFCKHYFYIFHSVVSTQMVYNKFAFKNYDSVCCNGSYQYNELIAEEEKYNLPRKNLIKSGYPFLDTLDRDLNKEYKRGTILVAPSWNPAISDFYEKYYSKILDDLLKGQFNVIFRSHPEYSKRFSKNFLEFKNKYSSNINIIFDDGEQLFETFKKCETVITDWSGIAYEFVYSSQRYVIFNEVPVKQLNNDTINREEIFEFKYRSQVGIICKPDDDILLIVDDLRKKNKDTKELDIFFEEKFYNLGNASDTIINNVKDILDTIRKK
jgi:YidC/Oxa1 family membrane protein insertase